MKRIIGFSVGALLLAALAATGGFFYGTTMGEARANSARDAFLQERGGGDGQFGFGGGGQFEHNGEEGQGAGGAARARGAGEVTGIEGDTLTLITDEGEIQVLVNGDTILRQTITLTLDELQPGEQIIVIGDRDPQGNLVARSIQVGVDFQQDGFQRNH